MNSIRSGTPNSSECRELFAPAFGVVLQCLVGGPDCFQRLDTAGRSLPRSTTYISSWPNPVYTRFPIHPKLVIAPRCNEPGSAMHCGRAPTPELRCSHPRAPPLLATAWLPPVSSRTTRRPVSPMFLRVELENRWAPSPIAESLRASHIRGRTSSSMFAPSPFPAPAEVRYCSYKRPPRN